MGLSERLSGAPSAGGSIWGDVALTSCIALVVGVLITFAQTRRKAFGGLPGLLSVRFGETHRRSIKRLLVTDDRVVRASDDLDDDDGTARSPSRSASTSVFLGARDKIQGGVKSVRRRIAGSEGPPWKDAVLLESERKSGSTPLLVIVNSKSGGQQGTMIVKQLTGLLHRVQLVDLKKETPDEALLWWSRTGAKYRILVCGGDGSVGWVLGTLDRLLNNTAHTYMPPVAILPLGTGNDLSIVLGWSGGWVGGSLLHVLKRVQQSQVSLLDRWVVTVKRPHNNITQRISRAAGRGAAGAEETKVIQMNNYVGIGVDAAITLMFHEARETKPHLFVSQFLNKFFYACVGLHNIIFRMCADLNTKVSIWCDGVPLKIPEHIEGITILNISSFGGGSDLWGMGQDEPCKRRAVSKRCLPDAEGVPGSVSEEGGLADDDQDSSSSSSSEEEPQKRPSEEPPQERREWAEPSQHDRMLEVVGTFGARDFAIAQIGLGNATRLAQAKRIRLVTHAKLPVQVDGEPFRLGEGGEISIAFKNQALMLTPSAQTTDAVATEVVEWGLRRNVIDTRQRNVLMKEIARRRRKAERLDD